MEWEKKKKIIDILTIAMTVCFVLATLIFEGAIISIMPGIVLKVFIGLLALGIDLLVVSFIIVDL